MTAPTSARPSRPVTLRPATTTAAGGRRIAVVVGWPEQRPLLADIVPVFERLGVRVANAVALPGEDDAPASRL